MCMVSCCCCCCCCRIIAAMLSMSRGTTVSIICSYLPIKPAKLLLMMTQLLQHDADAQPFTTQATT
jgi:hypothetical protein